MRRTHRYLLVATLIALLTSPPPAVADDADPWEGDVNIVVAQRSLDADFWRPVEVQPTLGVNVFFGRPHWPVRILAGGFFSTKQAASPTGTYDVTGETREFSLGVASNFRVGDFIPYVGGGASLVAAVARGGTGTVVASQDDDGSAGFFLTGGVSYRFAERFNIGFDLRYLGGTKVTLFKVDGDVNYAQAGVNFGWGF
jgi:opacity protein-like surface antigen